MPSYRRNPCSPASQALHTLGLRPATANESRLERGKSPRLSHRRRGKTPIRRLLSRGNTSPLHNFGQLFSVAFRLAHSTPRLVASDAPLFSFAWCRPCGRRTKHPSGSRLRDVSPSGATSAPGTCCAPENRQFPTASNRVLLKCSGSLVGPVSLWLTVEASPDSPIRWEAICYGLRSERIKRMVINHFSYPSPTPTQPQARPQPKALWTSKGTRSRMMS